MLVFSRHKNEDVIIGHNGEIKISIVEIRGDKVRIGIEAAREIPVHRGEIFKKIQLERSKGGIDGSDRNEAS